MPVRSKAQLRKLHALEARGELKPGTARRWAAHTPNITSLPERVGSSKKHTKRLKKIRTS
jgi:hypothetical protein